ncbi:ANL_collapsed_G0024150.mRNA.1.CDS.1 [Saccharomyces cerevisiae]|nr:ANL_collapsed_G0024150.mRNA.1.CDS.1 [Saccharomyces cerevisiae]
MSELENAHQGPLEGSATVSTNSNSYNEKSGNSTAPGTAGYNDNLAQAKPVSSYISHEGPPKDELEELQKKVDNQLEKKSKSDLLFVSVCCLMVAFGGFVFGWDTGTISGFVRQTDFIRRFGSTRANGTTYLSDVRTGLMVSIFNIGCAIGGIVLSKLGDIYGRKIGLMTVVVIYSIGIIIQIASIDKWYQYFIGRIISGLGVGGITVLAPMLISEVSPKQLRGTLVSCYQLMITFGIFLGYCTNFGTKITQTLSNGGYH